LDQALAMGLDQAMESMKKVKERKEQKAEVEEVEQFPQLVMAEGVPLQRVLLILNNKERILA